MTSLLILKCPDVCVQYLKTDPFCWGSPPGLSAHKKTWPKESRNPRGRGGGRATPI